MRYATLLASAFLASLTSATDPIQQRDPHAVALTGVDTVGVSAPTSLTSLLIAPKPTHPLGSQTTGSVIINPGGPFSLHTASLPTLSPRPPSLPTAFHTTGSGGTAVSGGGGGSSSSSSTTPSPISNPAATATPFAVAGLVAMVGLAVAL